MMNWKCISGFWPTEICHFAAIYDCCCYDCEGANASWTHGDWVTEQVARNCFRPHSTKTVTKIMPLWCGCTILCTPPYFVETHDPCKHLSLRNNLPNQWDAHPGISPNTRLSKCIILPVQMNAQHSAIHEHRKRTRRHNPISHLSFSYMMTWESLLPEQLSNTILCSIGLFYYPN